MSGEIEAAGAAITAGLAAGTIEGRKGARAGHGEAGVCLNCGATLAGPYCAQCGQSAHVERKLLHVFEEFLHGIIHFDAKAWRTLPRLVGRPGTLTFEYIRGRRARYVSPLAMFLFVVFIMFFVFALLGEPEFNSGETLADLRAQVSASSSALAKSEGELAAATAARDKLTARPNPGADALSDAQDAVAQAQENVADARKDAAAMAGKLARREAAISQLRTARAQLDVNEAKAKTSGNASEIDKIATSKALLDRALARAETVSEDGIAAKVETTGDVTVNVAAGKEEGMETLFDAIKRADEMGKIKVHTGSKKFDEKVHAKLRNPELGWYKIQNAAYKYSFLLVPLSLPFLAALFLFKKDVTFYDHVVFILYSLSFMSLLFMLIAVAGRFAPQTAPALATLALVAPPTHMFFHLGGAYRLRLFSALWRAAVLTICSLICFSVFIALIIVLGLTG